jgi:hypothetical protein
MQTMLTKLGVLLSTYPDVNSIDIEWHWREVIIPRMDPALQQALNQLNSAQLQNLINAMKNDIANHSTPASSLLKPYPASKLVGERTPLLAINCQEHSGLNNQVHAKELEKLFTDNELSPVVNLIIPTTVDGQLHELSTLLTRFERNIEGKCWKNAMAVLAPIFRTAMLIANFALAANITEGNPHWMALCMLIQATIYQVSLFIVDRLRSNRRMLKAFLIDWFGSWLTVVGLVEFFVAYDNIELTEHGLNDPVQMVTKAMAIALAAVYYEDELMNPLVAKIRDKFCRASGAFIQNGSDVTRPRGIMPPQPIFMQQVLVDGKWSSWFLTSALFTFAFQKYTPFLDWRKTEERALSPAYQNFDTSMFIWAAAVVFAIIMSCMTYHFKQ